MVERFILKSVAKWTWLVCMSMVFCLWLDESGLAAGGPRGQRVATRGLGVHGFCRSPRPASCYPWLGFSWFLQGLVRGKWQNNWVVMVFTGSCQWQGAKTHGFHGICRVLSVASGQNPWVFMVFAGSCQLQVGPQKLEKPDRCQGLTAIFLSRYIYIYIHTYIYIYS